MFSIRVHRAATPTAHDMISCHRYRVATDRDKRTATVMMRQKDGTEETVNLVDGDVAFVMNDGGQTVEIVRTRPESVQPRTSTGETGPRAQLRGGAASR